MKKYTIKQIEIILEAWEIIKEHIITNDEDKSVRYNFFHWNENYKKIKNAVEILKECK